MRRSPFKAWIALLLILGVLVEINHAYRQAMGMATTVMPAVEVLRLPRQMRHSPFAEMPIVEEFDGMTMTTGTIMFY